MPSRKTLHVVHKSIFRLTLMSLAGLVLSSALSITGLNWNGTANAQIALPQTVETQSLTRDAFETGILNARSGALPESLWQGSDGKTVAYLLDRVPARPQLPAISIALRRILLSSGDGPRDINGARYPELGGKKLLSLVRAGFTEEARTIASLSDADRNDPNVGQALALADLLDDNINGACARGASIDRDRSAAFWVKLRAFCYGVAGERDAADLTVSVLRERGDLNVREESYFAALVTGTLPKTLFEPHAALELAIVRHLQMPIATTLLKGANGGVVKALAADDSLDAETRILAARRAVAMGLMTGTDYGAVLMNAPIGELSEDRIAVAVSNQPGAPMTDAILYQQIQALDAPAFLRDRAALIATALATGAPDNGTGFDHSFTVHVLYAPAVGALEGALLPADQIAHFARARMAVGDGEGAARWLLAMKGDEPLTALGDNLGAEFLGLANLLAKFDPSNGAMVAASADIGLEDAGQDVTAKGTGPNKADLTQNNQAENRFETARITEAVVDAALGEPADGGSVRRKAGQAALAALVFANDPATEADPVRTVLMEQAWRVAGLEDVRRQVAFQSAWVSLAPKSVERSLTGGVVGRQSAQRLSRQATKDGRTPSLKPRRQP